MRVTNNEKLKMILEHIEERKTLSHICERYNYKDMAKEIILKELIYI